MCDRASIFESAHPDATLLDYHRHGIAFATIVLEGSYTEVRDGMPYAHSAGSVVLHAPSEEHADYFTSACRCLNVELDDVTASKSIDAVEMEPHVDRAVRGVVRSFSRRGFAGRNAVARFRASLNVLEPAASRPLPLWLKTSIENFAWPSGEPLREAARMAGVHQTHFSREFHRHLRMTPHAFRRQARVRRASELLLSTNVRTVAIAQECGFSDQSHFTRSFTAALGVAPAAFRRAFAR